MRHRLVSDVILTFCMSAMALSDCQAQGTKACDLITKAEAEAVAGVPLQDVRQSDRRCRFSEAGYGVDPTKKKQVILDVYHSPTADPEDVNHALQRFTHDATRQPVALTAVPGIGDAALWAWTGGWYGTLAAFRGGTMEVDVTISGLTEEAALAAAKRFTARALGGSTGYRYAAATTPTPAPVPGRPKVEPAPVKLAFRDPLPQFKGARYNLPGILEPLYYGRFQEIADDARTRNYVFSIRKGILDQPHSNCPAGTSHERPQSIFVLSQYAGYYETKNVLGSMTSAMKNDLNKAIAQQLEVLSRVQPHFLEEGVEDGSLFAGAAPCPAIVHLYSNMSDLAEERRTIPPDVDDDERYGRQMSSELQKLRGFVPGPPGRLTLGQKLKQACLDFTHGAAFPAQMEGFCRCQVDAALQSGLPKNELEHLATHFTQQTLADLSRRYAAFGRRKKDCYQ